MEILNINAAKELLAHYKSLTLAQLEHEWDEFEKETSEFWWQEEPLITGGDIMGSLTGFGTTGSCPLCNACNTKCDKCIYSLLEDYIKLDYPCLDKTYEDVDGSLNPEALYTNLQFRIERLEKAINIYEGKYKGSERTSN